MPFSADRRCASDCTTGPSQIQNDSSGLHVRTQTHSLFLTGADFFVTAFFFLASGAAAFVVTDALFAVTGFFGANAFFDGAFLAETFLVAVDVCFFVVGMVFYEVNACNTPRVLCLTECQMLRFLGLTFADVCVRRRTSFSTFMYAIYASYGDS